MSQLITGAPRLRAVLLCAGGLIAALAGGAYAATSGGAVRACVHHHGGGLYRARRCAAHDRLLTWSARGPQGLTGPQGPAGPPGAKGAPGTPGTPGATKVVVREALVDTSNLQQGTATAFCHPGEAATGGGWEMFHGSIPNFDVFADQPVTAGGVPPGDLETPLGWKVSVYNHSGQLDSWRVYVICASP
jgi:hypothetical protein